MSNSRTQRAEQRYTALLLFQFRVESGGVSNRRRSCEMQIILLQAPDARVALRVAKKRGRQKQHHYKNSSGGVVHFEFVGILDLLHLGVECEADEIWYEFCEMLEPMERRDRLIPLESKLQAIREERQRRREEQQRH